MLHIVVVDARSDVVDVTLYESVVNPERVETRLGDLEGLRFDLGTKKKRKERKRSHTKELLCTQS